VSGARNQPPTPRRIREARRRGEVTRSRELQGAVAFAAGLAALAATGPWAVAELAGAVRAALAPAGAAAAPTALLADAALRLARVGAPLLLLPAAGAAATAALAQGGVRLAADPLGPRLERLDPFRGLARLASPAAALQAALGLAKGGLLLALAATWVGGQARTLAQLPRLAPAALVRALPAGSLALRLGLAALAFGLLDLALARRRHRRALMMTREEVQRESKEDEGDPQQKAERGRLHRSLLEAGTVARATVVVVNPAHVAVALHHRRDGESAPRVVAKGLGPEAARIRAEARRAGVPIVRDVPLARALFRLVEIGDEIPGELFDAAAAILVHVYGTGGGGR
jgi:type III secretion protein U